MKKIKKNFDCLKEKERIHAKMLKEFSPGNLEEERAFYNQEIQNKKLASWVAKVKKHSGAPKKLKKAADW